MKTLNEAGHARLIKFLFENHKNAVPIVTYFLSSWIKDAEDHLRNDKHGYIELAASDSVCHRMRICNFDDTHFKDD